MRLGIGSRASDTELRVQDMTFAEFAEKLRFPKVGKKDGLYVVRGGLFREPYRGDENLVEAELIVIDGDSRFDASTGEIESGAPEFDIAAKAFHQLGVPFVLHSTHSNRPDRPKWRAYIPAHMVSPEELDACVAAVIERLNGFGCYVVQSKECTTWSQAWFTPRVPSEEALEWFRHEAVVDGPSFDVPAAVAVAQRQRVAAEAAMKAQEAPKPETAPTGPSPIETFNNAATLDLVRHMLVKAGYKFAYRRGDTLRLIAPGSETGTPGVTVFKGSRRGDIVVWSHHGHHDPLAGRLNDAFGVLTRVTHKGNQEAALEEAKSVIGWAKARDPLAGLEKIEITPEDFDKAPKPEPKVEGPRKAIEALPFKLVPEGSIPPRQWVYGRHLIRRFVSATVAPGGVGKSSLSFVEAMALATGKPLLGVNIEKPMKVWVWCLEDPREELDRRFTAIAKYYQVTGEEIGDRLFLNSGRDTPLCIARQEPRSGTIIVEPDMAEMESEITRLGVDVVTIDPFVASHMVSENDNVAINTVMRQWVLLAERCNIAIELIHHTRKNGDGEVTAETSRGAKALTDATRDTRVINQMNENEGTRFGVENRRLHFRTYSDKANLAPPAEQSDWYKLENIALLNGPGGVPGDYVGVATRWEVPGPFAKVSKETINGLLQAIDMGVIDSDGRPTGVPFTDSKRGRSNARWVGQVVMDHTGMEEEEAKRAIDAWVSSGVLVITDFELNRKPAKGLSVNRTAWSEMVEGANVR